MKRYEKRQTPYEKGVDAFHNHIGLCDNPYKTRKARLEWCVGFKDARRAKAMADALQRA